MSELEAEDVKEVYSRFGLAYYHGEVLHRGLCNFYVAVQTQIDGPVTRSRVEEHLQYAFSSTLGQIARVVQSQLPTELWLKIEKAIERRNFLAHYFWFERVQLMGNAAGINQLIAELSADIALFEEIDRAIWRLMLPHFDRVGFTPQVLAERMEKVQLGENLEPLPQRRKLRKQEVITGVHNAPTSQGRSVLVFETDDGLLWQLCEVGLGWAPYDRPDVSWTHAVKFSEFLPARINPRPATSQPWSFEISFGAARLEVRPGKERGQVLYALRR